jgi:hypothetical protein
MQKKIYLFAGTSIGLSEISPYYLKSWYLTNEKYAGQLGA